MASHSIFNSKIMVTAVSAIIFLGFSVWIHYRSPQNPQTHDSIDNTSNQNNTSFFLNGYCLTFNGSNYASLSSGHISLGFHFLVFTLNRNNFLQELPVSHFFKRIDNNVQNTVVVTDNYSKGSVTYIFSCLNGLALDYVIPPTSGMYILFSISFGYARFINSGSFVYSHNSSNSPDYGNYLISSNYQKHSIQFFDSYTDSGSLSWQQIQAQNLIDYEIITIAPYGDCMELMTGPYNPNVQATWSYSGICISSGGVPQYATW